VATYSARTGITPPREFDPFEAFLHDTPPEIVVEARAVGSHLLALSRPAELAERLAQIRIPMLGSWGKQLDSELAEEAPQELPHRQPVSR